MDSYEEVGEPDDESDEEDVEDEDDDDEEDDEEDAEDSRDDPTPTNETTVSDEFEWVQGSPMLTSLMQQQKDKEQAQIYTSARAQKSLSAIVGASDAGELDALQYQAECQKNVHLHLRQGVPDNVDEVVTGSHARDTGSCKGGFARMYFEGDANVGSEGGASGSGLRLRQQKRPVVQRREDYLVVGGEMEPPPLYPSDAHTVDSDALNRESSKKIRQHKRQPRPASRCQSRSYATCPRDCQSTCVALNLPPPPSSLPPLSLGHRGESLCTCSYEDLYTIPYSSDLRCVTPGASAYSSKTLPCNYRSRTPQPYRHVPSLEKEHLRPRAKSQTRVSRLRGSHFMDFDLRQSPCSCNCPYNHSRDLALEYMQWRSFFKANGLPPDYDDLQEKVQRLESDKESLTLQVTVLTEQIEAQTDKIKDLESVIETKKVQLENVEDMLQHGLMTLESQKLDLMAEISNLKLQLTSLEKEKFEVENRARKAELETISIKTHLVERERELSLAKSQAAGRYLQGNSLDSMKNGSHVSPDNSLRRLPQRYLEMEKLHKTLECVMAANNEKDRRIEELQDAVARYKLVQERVLSSHFPNSVPTEDEEVMDGGTQSPIGSGPKSNFIDQRISEKPPHGLRPSATSTPLPLKEGSAVSVKFIFFIC